MELVSAGDGSVVADVVFVHGLTGGPRSTWTTKEGVFWPKDLLASDLQSVRILSWGYDADIVNSKGATSQNSIFAHSGNLLGDLSSYRKSDEEKTRPIIFIAHSLGGLVVKEVYIRSWSMRHAGQDRRLGAISENVAGMIFLGTPHRGSPLADLGLLAANIASVVMARPNKHLLRSLKSDSDVMEKQREDFTTALKTSFPIACLVEEKPTKGGLVVPPYSAVMDGFGVKKNTIPANHMDMCKFSTAADVGYKRVLEYVNNFLEDKFAEIRDSKTGSPFTNDIQDRLMAYLGSNEAASSSSSGPQYPRDSVPPGKIDYPEQRFQTREALEGRDTGLSFLPTPPPPKSVRMNAAPSPNFLGQGKVLEEIRKTLSRSEWESAGTLKICALFGLPGVGKTEIVLQYTSWLCRDYEHVFWLQCGNAVPEETQFARIAKRLDISCREGERYFETVREWLEETDSHWLLVLDNVWDFADVAKYIPKRASIRGSVIITTCRPQSSSVISEKIHVHPLYGQAGVELFRAIARCSIDDFDHQRSIGRIVHDSGGIPIFIIAIAEHIRSEAKDVIEFVEEAGELDPLWSGLKNSLAQGHDTTLDAAFTKLISTLDPDSRRLLDVLAFLDGDRIDEKELLSPQSIESLAFTGSDQVDRKSLSRMISSLHNAGILKREQNGRSNSMLLVNRAVQLALIAQSQISPKSYWQACHLIDSQWPQLTFSNLSINLSDLHKFMMSMGHIYALRKYAELASRSATEAEQVSILSLFLKAAVFYWTGGHFDGAWDYAIFIETKLLSTIPISVRQSFSQAWRLVPEEDVNLLIPNHTRVLDGLLRIMISTERFKSNWEVSKRRMYLADEAQLRLSSEQWVKTSFLTRLELANVCLEDRAIDLAEIHYAEVQLLLQALSPEKTTPDHKMMIAKSHVGLGFCNLFKSDLNGARVESEKAEEILAAFDQATSSLEMHRIQFGVACIKFQIGKFEIAIDMYQRILTFRDKEFGRISTWTKICQYGLALVYWHIGDHKAAWDYLEMEPPPSASEPVVEGKADNCTLFQALAARGCRMSRECDWTFGSWEPIVERDEAGPEAPRHQTPGCTSESKELRLPVFDGFFCIFYDLGR